MVVLGGWKAMMKFGKFPYVYKGKVKLPKK
jgi:hypothetical protein